MGSATLPPGFRFHPTDEELVGYYLNRKVEGLEIELEVIPVIELYKFDPWELPEKSFLPKRDMEWFFFCPRDRKYPNGSRTNRATKAGYWKATGKDRKVVCQSSLTGYRKTLVFYRGRAPLGDRTDWVMHEYRLCDDQTQGTQTFQGAFALCRVVKRNEQAQKAKVNARDSSSNNDNLTSTSLVSNESGHSSPITSQYDVNPHPMAQYDPSNTETDPSKLWISPELILDSSKDCPRVGETMSEYFPQYEFSNSATQWHIYESTEISPSSSYSNFNGEIDPADNLSQLGGYNMNMSHYSGQLNYMDFPYEDYDQNNSLGFPKLF